MRIKQEVAYSSLESIGDILAGCMCLELSATMVQLKPRKRRYALQVTELKKEKRAQDGVLECSNIQGSLQEEPPEESEEWPGTKQCIVIQLRARQRVLHYGKNDKLYQMLPESQIKIRTETIALSSSIHLPIQCRTILLIVSVFHLTSFYLLCTENCSRSSDCGDKRDSHSFCLLKLTFFWSI